MTEANGFYFWEAAPGAGMLSDDAAWPPGYAPFGRPRWHQHQWYATSDAVVGQFDRDRFDGDVAALAAFGVPNHDLSKKQPLPATDPGGAIAGALGQEGNVVKEPNVVREPAEGKYTAYINDAGQTIFVANMGGEAVQVDGIAVVDLGVSVINKDGDKYDRSIQGDAIQAWHDRPKA